MCVVVTGPSCAGKSTIITELLKCRQFRLSVSLTTRMPRSNEVDGVDYRFVSKEQFEQSIQNGEIIEYTVFNGNYYGTPFKKEEDETITVFDVEWNGVEYFKRKMPDALFCLVTAEKKVIEERLWKRGVGEKEVAERLQSTEKYENMDQGIFDLVIENSGDYSGLKMRVKELKESILTKLRKNGNLF